MVPTATHNPDHQAGPGSGGHCDRNGHSCNIGQAMIECKGLGLNEGSEQKRMEETREVVLPLSSTKQPFPHNLKLSCCTPESQPCAEIRASTLSLVMKSIQFNRCTIVLAISNIRMNNYNKFPGANGLKTL